MNVVSRQIAMNGVGAKMIEALRQESTCGDADRYALRRLQDLLDDLAELPDANRILGQRYHRSIAVTDRRRKMAAV